MLEIFSPFSVSFSKEEFLILMLNSSQIYQSFSLQSVLFVSYLKSLARDFPGGSVDKNLPANAGDMGSVPGPGRFYTLWSNEAQVPQPLNPGARAREPQ